MKKILFIAFMFLAMASNSQVIFGYYDNLIRAKDSLIVDVDFMKSADTTVYLTDVTYHEFSSDSVTWSKNPSATDKWMRVSSDAKFTWKVLDLEGLERYWLNDGVYIYNNEDYGTKVHINTALVDSFDLNVGGDINTYGYIFIDKDSLNHTNIYNGGAVAGMYLVASGDTAVWQDLPSGFGETNLARNVNSRGVGVFEQKTDTILDFRGIASLTDLLTVNLASEDSTIDLDLDLKTITAGTGLTGGGSMENDINLAVSIPSLPAFVDIVDNSSDWFAFYDASAGIHYKLHVEDFLSDVGSSVDLFVDDAFQETSMDTLNLVAGNNVTLDYSSPGRVVINSASAPDITLNTFIHEPDAYIAFLNYLYSYDISEGTALKLSNAPTADWTTNKSYSEGNYIWTASGTSVYRYDIENDTTIVLSAANNEIQWLIGASDGIYAISRGEAYYINKTSVSPTPVFYGSTVTNYDITAATSVVDGDEYLVLYSDENDRQYYKKIRLDHSGFDNDAWTATTCSLGDDVHNSFGTADPYWWAYDINNVTKVFESTSYLTAGSGDCLNHRSDFKTYLVPSGRGFLEGNTDAIITLESTPVTPFSGTPTSYNIVSTVTGDGYGSASAALDRGIYVSRNNTIEYSDDYAYEQAISGFVYDIHAQPVTISVFNTGVNVIVGGLGYVYFHAYNESPKQFMQRQVYEVNNALTSATKVESAITFVYFDSNYTADGDPKQPYIPDGFDLLLDSVRVENDIDTLNMVAGDGISLTYLGGNGGVEISATKTDVEVDLSSYTQFSDLDTLSFLRSYTETDSIFNAHLASTITPSDTSWWGTNYWNMTATGIHHNGNVAVGSYAPDYGALRVTATSGNDWINYNYHRNSAGNGLYVGLTTGIVDERKLLSLNRGTSTTHEFYANGKVKFFNYGSGSSFTGTVENYLATDSNGNLIIASGTSSGGDDWGSQVVQTDATLTGDGTSTNPLSVVGSGGTTLWESSGGFINPINDENILIGGITSPTLRFESTNQPTRSASIYFDGTNLRGLYYDGSITYTPLIYGQKGIQTTGLLISNSSNYNDVDGSIRYNGTDILGRVGGSWVSLTSGSGTTLSEGAGIDITSNIVSLDISTLSSITGFNSSPYLPVYDAVNLTKKIAVSDFDADYFGSGTATDGYVLTADGAGNAAWEAVSSSSGGAPTDASYLVTASNATLTNEIVVGTAPSGDLGGTWNAISVNDNSHLHTGSTISDLSVSDLTSVTGTPSSSTYLRGDNTWATPGGSGTVTSVAAGNGMDFTTITSSGTVTLGIPSSVTVSSTNSTTTTSHTHALDLSGRSVLTQYSLTGGGNLGSNRTLNLVGDVASPGNSKYYGTNSSGTRGFYDLPSGSGPNLTVQTLSGTTPAWNMSNGINAKITLSGNTTITLSNVPSGYSGNLTVMNAATAYTITFAGTGYTFKISPTLDASSGAITMSGWSNIDVLSWYFDGTYIIINGTFGYE